MGSGLDDGIKLSVFKNIKSDISVRNPREDVDQVVGWLCI